MRGVYIVSSRTRPAYKVGKHRGTMAALIARYKTALSDPVIELFVETAYYAAAEASVLQTLDAYRTRDAAGRKTEWIDLPLADIKHIVTDIAGGDVAPRPHAHFYILSEIRTAAEYERLTGVQFVSVGAATYARTGTTWSEFAHFPAHNTGCTKCGIITQPHQCGGIIAPIMLDCDGILASSAREGYFVTRATPLAHYFAAGGIVYEATTSARPRKLGPRTIVLDVPVPNLNYTKPVGRISISAAVLAGFGAFCRDFFGGAADYVFEDGPTRLLADALVAVAAIFGRTVPVADMTDVDDIAEYNIRASRLPGGTIIVSPFTKYVAADPELRANIEWFILDSLKK